MVKKAANPFQEAAFRLESMEQSVFPASAGWDSNSE
jgi:hypothetical protein